MVITHFSIGHQDYQGSWVGGPNSAGGVSVKISFKNESPKTIKYATFTVTPVNAVKDVVACTVRGRTEAYLKLTGPVGGNTSSNGNFWENVWYNHSISTAVMTCVDVEYMDGSTESFEGDNLKFNLQSGGCCYVATCVYGSYDCPQVWTLRRYRDDTLSRTWYGRAFIRTYYAISPAFVKWFGETRWFKKLWRGTLDKMVKKLQSKGVESTPYEDKVW